MKTISAKLYPTPSQESDMLRFLSVGRWIYNRALEQRIKAYRRRGQSLTYYDQQALLTKWRAAIQFVRSVPAKVERDALRRVDRGMKSFFRRVSEGAARKGFPRFKSYHRWRSFEVLQPGRYVYGTQLHIPGIGRMRYRGLPTFDGTIKGVRVMHKPSGWHVQLLVDAGPAPPKRIIAKSIGIDLGLTHFATLSTGEKIDNPRWYRSAQRRLRFLQRIASRRHKGSKRRRKAYERVARLHERIADARKDWTHKLSRRLVNENDLIAIEDLNVRGMARAHFAKSISDAAWSQFATQLTYKAENAGKWLVRVSPRNTSIECSECGLAVPKVLSERVHSCECGYMADRDENAARNVLRRVPAELTRGESTLAGGVAKRTPRRGSLNREGKSLADVGK